MNTELAIRAHSLLPHANATVIRDAVLHVRDQLITYAGPAGQAPPWRGPVIDLPASTLMPGLFDCHVHLCMDPSAASASAEAAADEDALRNLMLANASRLLDAGVTTARDLGAPGTMGTEVRDLLAAQRETAAPRMLVANAPVTVTGGHAHSMGGEADGVDGVVAQVRRLAQQGVDLVKVMTTGGFMTAGSQPWQARYSVEELTALVAEAHRHELPVTTHALGIEGIRRAVVAGVDTIEHCGWVTKDGTRFDPELAQLIVDKGVSVSPTMNSACTAESYFCPWDDRERVIGNLRELIAHDPVIVAGTDAGIGLVDFERFAACPQIFLEAGMPIRDVLASATSVAAEVCGLGDVSGQLAPGFNADVIAVDGDPTQDLSVLAQPKFVLAAGRVHQVRAYQATVPAGTDMARLHAELASGAGRDKQ